MKVRIAGSPRSAITLRVPTPSLVHTHWAMRVRLDVIYAIIVK